MMLTIGEVLMRLSSRNGEPLTSCRSFNSYIGGAEINVAKSLAQMGIPTRLYSVLPDNDIGEKALKDIEAAGVESKWIHKDGDRLGLYFHEEGFSLKPASVTYDRKHSSFLSLPDNRVKPGDLFEGVTHLHVTGITLAVDKSVREYVKWIIRQANEYNVFVSFDMNYRAKLWSQDEAGLELKEILQYVDFLFAGEKDFRYLLKWSGPDLNTKEVLAYYYEKLCREFQIQGAASTLREIYDQHHHALTGYLYLNGSLIESDKIEFEVKDRIGGGDGFASGVLFGLMNGTEAEETLRRGVAISSYQHFFKGDQTYVPERMIDTITSRVVEDVKR